MVDKIAKIGRFNFWDSTPNLGFVRQSYLNKIENYLNTSLIKVLIGQRRVGKSYVLRQIIHRLIQDGIKAKQTLYINKEFSEFDFLVNHSDLYEFVRAYQTANKIKGKLYVFVDEVQLIEEWEKVINALSQDFTANFEIFITGSNSQLLSGELSTLLSGRYVQFTVYPYSFMEFCEFQSFELNKKNYQLFMQSGALPELLNLPQEESKRQYLLALKDTIILRDIVARYQIKDTRLLLDVFAYLSSTISSLFSVNNLVNYFASKNRKTNYETLSSYLFYLTNTFVVHRCERYEIKGKEILSGNNKYYLNDLSFKNYLFGGFALGYGHLLENMIYLELVQHGFEVYVGAVRDKEIDFVALKNGKTLYVQVAYLLSEKTTVDREYNNLLSIKDNYPKWVVSMDDLPLPENKGILNIPAWELSKHLSKIE